MKDHPNCSVEACALVSNLHFRKREISQFHAILPTEAKAVSICKTVSCGLRAIIVQMRKRFVTNGATRQNTDLKWYS